MPFLSGSEMLAIRSATGAVAFRIDPETTDEAKQSARSVYINDRKVIRGPYEQDTKWLADLNGALAELQKISETEDVRDPKPCETTPGVVFRLIGPSDQIDITICYECGEFWSNGFRLANFVRIGSKMIDLAKRAFPQDKEIQRLGDSE